MKEAGRAVATFDAERVRAVTFDAGGTLLEPHPGVGAIYAEVAARWDVVVSADTVERRFRESFGALRGPPRAVVNEGTERAFWRAVVQRSLAPECPAEKLEAVFGALWEEFARAARWRARPGAAELLENLAAGTAKRPLAVLSNWDGRLRRVLGEMGWEKYFGGIYISSELGAEKPDARVFRAVEGALGRRPEELLHVGDSWAHDYCGARAAGWQAVLVGGKPPAGEPGAAQVADLDELAGLLA